MCLYGRAVTIAHAAVIALAFAATPLGAHAQGTLDAAMGLYGSAAYDDALAMLEGLPVEDADPTAAASLPVDVLYGATPDDRLTLITSAMANPTNSSASAIAPYPWATSSPGCPWGWDSHQPE